MGRFETVKGIVASDAARSVPPMIMLEGDARFTATSEVGVLSRPIWLSWNAADDKNSAVGAVMSWLEVHMPGR